jgi:hypothetical protein
MGKPIQATPFYVFEVVQNLLGVSQLGMKQTFIALVVCRRVDSHWLSMQAIRHLC